MNEPRAETTTEPEQSARTLEELRAAIFEAAPLVMLCDVVTAYERAIEAAVERRYQGLLAAAKSLVDADRVLRGLHPREIASAAGWQSRVAAAWRVHDRARDHIEREVVALTAIEGAQGEKNDG